MLQEYRQHCKERAQLGIPPLPLDAKQKSKLCELWKNPIKGEEAVLLELLRSCIPPGVDQGEKL